MGVDARLDVDVYSSESTRGSPVVKYELLHALFSQQKPGRCGKPVGTVFSVTPIAQEQLSGEMPCLFRCACHDEL